MEFLQSEIPSFMHRQFEEYDFKIAIIPLFKRLHQLRDRSR